MKLRRLAGAALVASMLLATGCWDLREMNQLALVMAVGVDKAETPGRVQVTVQIARPSARGKGSGSENGGGQSVYIATADGDTLFGAIRNLAQFTSRRIMWAHNNVVVIGESLAREDITPVIDFFTRNQELRMRTWIAVARGAEAKEILATATGMEDIPANSISALLRYAQLPGESVRSEVADVTHAFFAPDLNPVIATLMLKPRGLSPTQQPSQAEPGMQAVLAGTAIINKTRLMGYAERETGRGLLWLRAQMSNAVLTIPCPKGKPGTMAVEIRSPKVRRQSRIVGRTPVMQITVATEGWLSEQGCPTPTLRTTDLKQYVTQAMAAKIEAEMRATLDLLQQDLKTDAARYARTVHMQQPDWWRLNGAHWDEIFPQVKTQISVSATITKMSLYTRPMRAHTP
ncbi:MAG TPA: Ger(x)C family spore germination protein [Symbiobacteriaceae bacterium]|nr:Ger(x)C family spore germination protein [Symbiobacteriaceae bacterium]